MIDFLKKYRFSVILMALIFYLSVRSSMPDVYNLSKNYGLVEDSELVHYNMLYIRDFMGHLCFYFLLSLSLFWENARVGVSVSSSSMFSRSVVFPIAFGGIMELVQEWFFPPRSAEWMDWLSDSIGVFLAYLIARCYYKKTKKVC